MVAVIYVFIFSLLGVKKMDHRKSDIMSRNKCRDASWGTCKYFDTQINRRGRVKGIKTVKFVYLKL